MSEKLRVGVIGAGNIALKHLEVLAAFEDTEVVALCSRGHPRVHALADRFQVRKIFTDYVQMLDTVEMDAVFVLVSVTGIVEAGSECLRRRLPMLLEKPPGLRPDETRALRDLACAHDCLNMVGLNRRFYSVMRRAREAILEVGPLVSIVVEAPERLSDSLALGIHPPEVIAGMLYANGIHCLDLLRYFGGEVSEVHTIAGQWVEAQKDSFNALLRFESGATGHYISNWTSPARWSVTLYGAGRQVILKPLERASLVAFDQAETLLAVDEVDQLYKPGLYAQNRYFLDCVKERRPVSYPAADLADAFKTMELIEAIEGGKG